MMARLSQTFVKSRGREDVSLQEKNSFTDKTLRHKFSYGSTGVKVLYLLPFCWFAVTGEPPCVAREACRYSGNRFTFPCRSDARHTTYRFNGKNIVDMQGTTRSAGHDANDQFLDINNLTARDTGHYECLATTNDNQVFKNCVTLVVVDTHAQALRCKKRLRPTLSETERAKGRVRNVFALTGESLALSCGLSTKSFDPMHRAWFFNSKWITSDTPGRRYYSEDSAILILKSVHFTEDAGTFNCTGVNIYGTEFILNNLTTVRYDKKVNSVSSLAGRKLVLDCQFTSSQPVPASLISWQYNDQSLDNATCWRKLSNGSLTCDTLQAAHSGRYSCSVKLANGILTTQTTLVVGGLPSDVSVFVFNETLSTLFWTAGPSHPPVLYYHIGISLFGASVQLLRSFIVNGNTSSAKIHLKSPASATVLCHWTTLADFHFRITIRPVNVIGRGGEKSTESRYIELLEHTEAKTKIKLRSSNYDVSRSQCKEEEIKLHDVAAMQFPFLANLTRLVSNSSRCLRDINFEKASPSCSTKSRVVDVVFSAKVLSAFDAFKALASHVTQSSMLADTKEWHIERLCLSYWIPSHRHLCWKNYENMPTSMTTRTVHQTTTATRSSPTTGSTTGPAPRQTSDLFFTVTASALATIFPLFL